MIERVPTMAVALMVLLLNVIAAGMVYADMQSGEMGEYYDDAEQWCDSHNGRLVNSQAILHGGLHCKLDNGTSVHMHEVIDND